MINDPSMSRPLSRSPSALGARTWSIAVNQTPPPIRLSLGPFLSVATAAPGATSVAFSPAACHQISIGQTNSTCRTTSALVTTTSGARPPVPAKSTSLDIALISLGTAPTTVTTTMIALAATTTTTTAGALADARATKTPHSARRCARRPKISRSMRRGPAAFNARRRPQSQRRRRHRNQSANHSTRRCSAASARNKQGTQWRRWRKRRRFRISQTRRKRATRDRYARVCATAPGWIGGSPLA